MSAKASRFSSAGPAMEFDLQRRNILENHVLGPDLVVDETMDIIAGF